MPGSTALTTWAVKVTAWPPDDPFPEEVTVVAVPARSTVWVSEPEVLGWKLASPLYVARTWCGPRLRLAMLKLAWPAAFRETPGDWATLSRTKVTVPVGAPAPGGPAMVAVK